MRSVEITENTVPKVPGLVLLVPFLRACAAQFLLFAVIVLGGMASAWAQFESANGLALNGHFKTTAMQTSQAHYNQLGGFDFRANADTTSLFGLDNVRLQAQYQLQGQAGSVLAQPGASAWQNPDTTQWFNLSGQLVSQTEQVVWHRLDRLNISYTNATLALKLGRQALSWGRGNVFNPMDLFNPFAPNSIDTEYKPGTDMLQAQWLLDSGNDLTLIMVPRRDATTGKFEQSQGSMALKGSYFTETLEWQWMLAKDYQETVAAYSLSGAWQEGSWNWDGVASQQVSGQWILSSVINYNRALSLVGHNAMAFVEFYHNGYGQTQARPQADKLNQAWLLHQARGQVFVVNRHYADAGLTLEWSPLVTLTGNAMHNLQDGSGQLHLAATVSVTQNMQLLSGLQLPYGATGTEFGGLRLTNNASLANPSQIYLQLNGYF